MSQKLRIFALGGNEISPTGLTDPQTGKALVPDIKMQWERSQKTMEIIGDIIALEQESMFVLAHGNGPQVGNILRRSELAAEHVFPLPLDVCGADSQGAIGYMLAQLTNSMHVRGVNKVACEIITQVEVDGNDPAFQDPGKFIGSAMTKTEADSAKTELGWDVKMYKKNDAGEEIWRRVVPSPLPMNVVEIEAIEALLNAGQVPIAVGGGGIPVVKVAPKTENGKQVYESRFGIKFDSKTLDTKADVFCGVEGVIDKDLASSLLGNILKDRAAARGQEMEADFFIFTDVDGAKLNYQQPNQVDLRTITVSEAEKLIAEGHFAAGSMGPKIQACVDFVKRGGKSASITRCDLYKETVEGTSGTTIIAD
ncbi:MAG: carbamate kinase [Bacteriovoracaceae bacterium]|nr:carbamate kinase [Bacteriovoracaceae bacterium]